MSALAKSGTDSCGHRHVRVREGHPWREPRALTSIPGPRTAFGQLIE